MKLWQRALSRHSLLDASFNGSQLYTMLQSWHDGEERLPTDFRDYVQAGYQSNGVVFSCILARLLLLSEVEFAFQNRKTRRLFGTEALQPLERPWANGSTGELVARAEQDVSLAGNFYLRSVPGGVERMQPDWVTIISELRGSRRHLLGYTYQPGGEESGAPLEFLPADEVVHWSPIPDPLSPFRGMSWITPVAREVVGDTAMSRHKNKFFDNAATPNLLIVLKEKLEKEQRERFVETLRQRHAGVDNAYRTMMLDAAGGADVSVVGTNFEQIAFATTQAAGENRIAIASGVPSIVVGLKEGLQAATYSNYAQAMRRFGDLTARPLWRSMCAAFAPLVRNPSGSRLWYDDRHIPALKQDAKDEAEIRQINAATVRQLTESGYTPESIKDFVTSGDPTVLEHTGMFSVQLQPPSSGRPDAAA